MSDLLILLAGAWLLGLGLWLATRPWAHRHWLRDDEIGHRTRVSLYVAHMGDDPDWIDYTPPHPPPAIRNARIYRRAGLAAMAAGAAILYVPLSRTGVL